MVETTTLDRTQEHRNTGTQGTQEHRNTGTQGTQGTQDTGTLTQQGRRERAVGSSSADPNEYLCREDSRQLQSN